MALRLNSIQRLGTIALALGEERTRSELVPFLSDCNDDEDEVLLAMATELGQLISHVGGAEHAHCLLQPLEQLSTVEETVVRQKAVESLCSVGAALPASSVEQHFVPLVKRLAEGEWFTVRVSACGLVSTAYPRSSPPSQAQLRELFGQLCQDETPMVRRAAAQSLTAYGGCVGKDVLKGSVMEHFSAFTKDDQDSVRLLAVEGCGGLAKLLGKETTVSDVLPLVKSFAGDRSWRVRYMVAQQLYDLCDVIGADLARSERL